MEVELVASAMDELNGEVAALLGRDWLQIEAI